MAKIQIRQGVFETNSSSVHSITVVNNDMYEKWVKGEVLFCMDLEQFCAEDQIPEEFIQKFEKFGTKYPKTSEERLELGLYDAQGVFITYDEYTSIVGNIYEYETFNTLRTLKGPNGEEMKARVFGYYGYDG